jgi:ribosomal-protein-alanine N-acetyltransferase
MTPELRAVNSSDAPALAALHAQSFPIAWSSDEIAALLNGPGGFGLVACDGDEDRAIGFLLGRAIEGEAEILTLAVDPALRRKGVGSALVETAAGLVGAAGSSSLFLEVATDNEAGLCLYTAAGFARAGFRPAYYTRQDGVAVDALVLRRDLTP